MSEKSEIQLREWNYDTNKWDDKGTVSTYTIVRSIKPEQFTYLLSEYINVGMKDLGEGKRVGTEFQSEHRTLQGSLFRFCMGVIIGLSKQQYTDARNEIPVATAKIISDMVDKGELKLGWMI